MASTARSLASSLARVSLRSSNYAIGTAATSRSALLSTSTRASKPATSSGPETSNAFADANAPPLPSATRDQESASSSSALMASDALEAALIAASRSKLPSARRGESKSGDKTTRVLTRVGKARQILQWNWLSEEQLRAIAIVLEAPNAEKGLPNWLDKEHEVASSFRSARSRLWLPSTIPEGQQVSSDAFETNLTVSAWVDQQVSQVKDEKFWSDLSYEEQRDEVLKSVWRSYSPQERVNALTECKFTCIRKLGWRQGYSAGFPVAAGTEDAKRRAELVTATADKGEGGLVALDELRERDEEAAWQAWVSMDPATRHAEERDAWEHRDRSTLYIDDSPECNVLGAHLPRWYQIPQRAGKLVFLPNIKVRLVRNSTHKGVPYDHWKATFRVPLNLHKHAVKSYLLAVYGLQTTWIRSMIYRGQLHSRKGPNMKSKTLGNQGHRTYKKVEVGLLEPFAFPWITEEVKRSHFAELAMLQARRKAMTRENGRRWRSGSVPLPLASTIKEARDAEANDDPEAGDEVVRVDPEDAVPEILKKKDASGAPLGTYEGRALMARGQMVRVTRHNKILKLIRDKQLARTQQIDARVGAEKEAEGKAKSEVEARAAQAKEQSKQ